MAMPDLATLIASTASKYNLDPQLVSAVVVQESSGNPAAHNASGGGSGAWGAMQVRGPALADYNAANGTKYVPKDLTNPAVGLDVGSWYLDQQLQKFQNPAQALTAYKNGANSPQTQQGASPYAQQVLGRLGASGGPSPQGDVGGAAPQTQSGAPAANTAAHNVLAQFGYGADGNPVQSSGAASTQAPATAAQSAALMPSAGGASDVLAKFGYGADGKPSPSAASTAPQAPAQPSAAPNPAPPQQSGFKPIPGDQTANAQAGEEAAAQATGEFGSGLWRGAAGLAGGAAQLVAHGAKTAVNTLAPASGLAGMINQGSNWLDQKLAANQKAIPDTPSGTAGEVVGSSLPLAAVPGGTLARAIVGGAAAGAAQPVTQNAGDNFWAQKGVQTGLGAATAGAADVGTSALGKLAQRFAPQESEAIQRIRNILNGQKVEAQAQPEVAGVQPTLAEMTGNANLGVAQRQFQEANPQPFAERAAANDAARQGAFGEAVKSPAEAQMAAQEGAQKSQWQYENSGVGSLAPDAELGEILQRPSMAPVLRRAEAISAEDGSNVFEAQRQALQQGQNQRFQQLAGTPEDVEAAEQAREAAVFDRYQAAGAQELPVDESFQMLLQRPSMQRVITRAQRLSDEEGAGPLFIHDEEGNNQSLSGEAAHYIKQGLDDEIQLARDNNLGASEKRAIQGTQRQFLGWLDNQSEDYAGARGTYRELTQPIEAQRYLQGLNVTDSQGNLNLSKLDTALKKTESLRQSPGLNQAKNLTDDQMFELYDLRNNLRSVSNGPEVNQFSPQQIQYVQRALDDEIAKGTRGATANENESLTQSRQDLENWLGSRAPGYQESKRTAEQASRDLETNQFLQKDITDSMGRLQLNRIEQKVKQIEDAKRLQSDTPAARVPDETLERLRTLRDSFRVEKNAEAATKGSPTKQNLDFRNRLGLNPGTPETSAATSALSRATGAATGAGVGWAAGNLVAPGLGGVVGSGVGGLVGGAVEKRMAARAAQQAQTRLADVIDKGTDAFLNPTPELIKQLNTTPKGQVLLRMLNAGRAAMPGAVGGAAGGAGFRSATQ